MSEFTMPDFAGQQCCAVETDAALQAALKVCNLAAEIQVQFQEYDTATEQWNPLDESELTKSQIVISTDPEPGTSISSEVSEIKVSVEEAGSPHDRAILPDYSEYSSDVAWALPMMMAQLNVMFSDAVQPFVSLSVTDGAGNDLELLTQTLSGQAIEPGATIEFEIPTAQPIDPSQPLPPPPPPEYKMPSFPPPGEDPQEFWEAGTAAVGVLETTSGALNVVNVVDGNWAPCDPSPNDAVTATNPPGGDKVQGGMPEFAIVVEEAANTPAVVLPNLQGYNLRDAVATLVGLLNVGGFTAGAGTPALLQVTSTGEKSVVIEQAPVGQINGGPAQVVVVNPVR